jgi:hypothetical protein
MDRPSGPKEGRAYAVASAAQQGWIKLVAGPHTNEVVDELAQFPNGRHDDCVDALSGAHRALGRRHPIYCRISVARGSIPTPSASGRIWSFEEPLPCW